MPNNSALSLAHVMRSKSCYLAMALSVASAFVMAAPLAASPQQPISVSVDARDSARKLFHSELVIPVRAGPLTLVYPRWGIPTYSLPAAAVNNIVRLKMTGNGRALEWKRDPIDMFSFHVFIPDDIKFLNIAMDVVAPIQRSDLNAATAQLFVLDWYTLVLYPQGAAVDEIPVEAQLRLPQGWKHACAMTSAGTTDGVVKFQRTSLRTLVDSPVLAGKNFTTLELRSGLAPPFYVDIAAEKPEMAALSPEWQDRFRRLATEAGALFGGYPHEQYHFLIALSDEVGNDGLEHRQSSDIRMSLRSFSDDVSRLSWGYLVPHEYVHSWNGTFRVPAGSIRRDYQQPHNTELHWVYAKTTTDVISPGHLGKTFQRP
jgi:predicted metalloprotease with PDZ domain